MMIRPSSDLARSLATQTQSALLKSRQAELTQELTTGQIADPLRKLQGDASQLSYLERATELQETYARNNSEVRQMADATQLALGVIIDSANDLLEALVIGPQTNLPDIAQIARSEARNSMDAVFSALNTQVAGRHLFSGVDVSTPPLPDSEVILTSIDTAIAGLTSVTDIVTAIDNFFDAAGVFETTIYQGAVADSDPIAISARENVSLSVRADDQAIRDAIKSAAYTYAAGAPSVTLTPEDQRNLMVIARDFTFNAKDEVIAESTSIGFSQSRIEESFVRLTAEKTETEKARQELLGADPFEAATRLEDVNSRLELLYAATARASRLSFLEFIR